MPVRTDLPASIPSLPAARNADPRPEALPALARARGRSRSSGALLLALVWTLALAFFVLGVAAPAAILERHARAASATAEQVASAAR